MDIHYRPTEKMVTDYYTKPIQGKLFKSLRNYTRGISNFKLSKECVERNRFLDVEKLNPWLEQERKRTYADAVCMGKHKNLAMNARDGIM